MIANLKIAHVAHLALVKLAATKAIVGAGLLVGGAATGLVAAEIAAPDYVGAANASINQAVDAEAGRTSPLLRPVELPSSTSSPIDKPAASIPPPEILEVQSLASTWATDPAALCGNIPQVLITGKRMSALQKLTYDINTRASLLASQR